MVTIAQVEQALHSHVPESLHHLLPQLARLLAALANGASPNNIPTQPEMNSSTFMACVEQLAGKCLLTGDSLLSFGVGNELGNVTISDMAGGSIVKVSMTQSFSGSQINQTASTVTTQIGHQTNIYCRNIADHEYPQHNGIADGQHSQFVVGPPVVYPRAFFGRLREVRRIFNLWKSLPLQNAAIIGPRRSGKTSLLYYLSSINRTPVEELREGQRNDWLPAAAHYQWILVDFQDPRLSTRERLLHYLLNELRLPNSRPHYYVSEQYSLEYFFDVVSESLTTPTIIMFDEIGSALKRCPELDNVFWESLRSLATHGVRGNLAFVLTSHDFPEVVAQSQGVGSPFFNIFGFVTKLQPLTELEALELVNSAPHPFPSEDVEWILEVSSRWPILLNLLCREKLTSCMAGEDNSDWRVDAQSQIALFDHLLKLQS